MNKLILFTALCLASACGKLCAQSSYVEKHSYGDRMFNLYPPLVTHRHTTHLPKNELMTVELTDLRDYSLFNNLDSVIKMLLKDIEFYKDSLQVTQHVRIDYLVTIGSEHRSMRFKKYNTEGDLYIIQDKEVSQLKIDQDTIHIMIKKPDALDRRNRDYLFDYPAQITFCLNNYTNLEDLVKDKSILKELIDTMASVIKPKEANPLGSQSVLDYYPDRPFNKIVRNSIAATEENPFPNIKPRNNTLTVDMNIGVGLVRNTICPVAEFGIRYNKWWGMDLDDITFFRLSASPYYFFDKNTDGGFAVNTNWFVNAELGTTIQTRSGYRKTPTTIGIGYLFAGNGGYFKNVTTKIFTSVRLKAGGISIAPEVIFTNNFKQIFPGITIWLF